MLNDFGVPLPYQFGFLITHSKGDCSKKCYLHNDVYHVLPSLIKDVNLWKPLFILLILVMYLHDNSSEDTGLELNTHKPLQRNH